MIYIGIDTGVTTGFAVWDATLQVFLEVTSMKIHTAMFRVLSLKKEYGEQNINVLVEDARLRKFFKGENTSAKSQGAGSVKRDAKVWEDFLKDYNIPCELINPMRNTTKTTKEYFKSITKWSKITNEHSRDAGMLVFGMKENLISKMKRTKKNTYDK